MRDDDVTPLADTAFAAVSARSVRKAEILSETEASDNVSKLQMDHANADVDKLESNFADYTTKAKHNETLLQFVTALFLLLGAFSLWFAATYPWAEAFRSIAPQIAPEPRASIAGMALTILALTTVYLLAVRLFETPAAKDVQHAASILNTKFGDFMKTLSGQFQAKDPGSLAAAAFDYASAIAIFERVRRSVEMYEPIRRALKAGLIIAIAFGVTALLLLSNTHGLALIAGWFVFAAFVLLHFFHASPIRYSPIVDLGKMELATKVLIFDIAVCLYHLRATTPAGASILIGKMARPA